MKNTFFIKAFAVLGIFASVSCVKEAVQDKPEDVDRPVVDVPAFTASFETLETKSTLEGHTPKWVEDDVIGVTTADDANVGCRLLDAAKGTFSAENINGSAPFLAVYPYAEGNTFEGDVLTAVVPSEQQLAKGQKVAPGALVAACKSENTTLSFKNCVALMQLTVPAGIKQVEVAATKEGEKLSGKFTMDLSADVLAPAAAGDAASNVVLKPEGESFEAGTYYISVIPSRISEIAVTFTNLADETVTVTKKAATAFVRSNGQDLGSFFVYEINTAEDLIKWARQSAKFTAWDVVTLKNDIALSADEASKYVEANNFYGEFNGNSHTISGLTCPLFGNIQSAYIHDLKLSANITTNGKTSAQIKGIDYGVGILGHYAYPKGNVAAATRENPKIENVEVSGSITVSGLSAAHNYNLGGVLGASNNVPLVGCINNAAVTYESGTTTGSGTFVAVGGIVGATQTGVNADLTNCTNNGDIVMAGGCVGTPSIGGVVGNSTQAVLFKTCTNNGNVTLDKNIASGTPNVGGVLGYTTAASVCENCINSGIVTVNVGKSCAAGGLVGKAVAALAVKSCENSGEVRYVAETAAYAIFGGIIGNANHDSIVISDSENKGKLTFSSKATNRVDIGGVVGIAGKTSGGYFLQNVTNSGDIEITGTAGSGSTSDQFRIGGLIGNLSVGGTLGKTSAGEDAPCYNSGNIIINSPQNKDLRASGCVGSATSKATNLYNLHNTGSISVKITGSVTCPNLDCGGVVGYIGNNAYTIASCDSKSSLTSAGTITNNNIAAILGRSLATTSVTTRVISNCGVGGSINGTEITEENMEDYVYKKATAPTIEGTYLVE
ncbi:MAG: hypothetical protein ACI3ZQ_03290 [Candidatus Cryptobacteroides sp.]